MRRQIVTATMLLILSSPLFAPAAVLAAQDGTTDTSPDPRVEVATEWIGYLDRGEFEGTWETASSETRAIFSRSAWIATLRTARDGLDELRSREVVDVSDTSQPPAAPPGEYATVTLRSHFSTRTITESVTLIDSDGNGWQVFGYQKR